MGDSDFLEACRANLAELWREATSASSRSNDAATEALSEQVAHDVRESVNSVTKTYRYVLPTQLLAKQVVPSLDCRCIQAARGGAGAFDARTVAHEVVVPFDRANENVLGGSPEPYVNNPLRIAAVSAEFRDAQKNKSGWDALCRVLDEVETRDSPRFTGQVLSFVVGAIAERLAHVRVVYPTPRRISLANTLELIRQFLADRSGGDRFESVTSALFRVVGKRFELFANVRRASTNTADLSAGMLGDIECIDANGRTVMVVEAKDRALTVRQIEDKIPGLRENQIAEAFFIAGRGVSGAEVETINELIGREFVSGQNLYVMELEPLARVLLAMIGEIGRREFLERVGQELDTYSDILQRRAWAKLLSDV